MIKQIKRDFFLLMEEKHVDKCSKYQKAREKLMLDARYSNVQDAYQREEWWQEFCQEKLNHVCILILKPVCYFILIGYVDL